MIRRAAGMARSASTPAGGTAAAAAATKRVLVGGGSGFVGRAVVDALRRRGHEVAVVGRRAGGPVDRSWDDLEREGVAGYDVVVNLAGANIFAPRLWTDEYRNECVSSRVGTTATLARLIGEAGDRAPEKLVATSAVGAYPAGDDTRVWDETSELPPPSDFPTRLCADIEGAAAAAASNGRTSVAVVRPGIVLGRGGGVFANLRLPFLACLGAPIGSGRQPFPFVHVDDAAGIYVHAVEGGDAVTGPLNAVAPENGERLVSNLDFTRALASAMNRHSWPFGAPGFVMRAVMGEDRGPMLLEGQRVAPRRVRDTGFEFAYPDLASTCAELVK